MSAIFKFNALAKQLVWLICIFVTTQHFTSAQRVENRGCPTSYFRNNGNGQTVTVFASNITTNSSFFQNALTNGNQGNFTLKWDVAIVNPPVINKTWVTSTSGITTQNWVFGNNNTGSPFNPPGVPEVGDVKYTFYNYNLPTAGVITLELIDPFDMSHVNTCSYPLTSGSTSTSSLTSLAVAPPSNLVYDVPETTILEGAAGNSNKPSVNAAGGTPFFSLSPQVDGVSINSGNGVISWSNNIARGSHNFTVKVSNGIQPDITTNYTISVSEAGVTTGNEGGLESKSIGSALAERAFNNVMIGKPEQMQYALQSLLSDQYALRLNGLTVRDFMPDQQVLGNGFSGYITSPVDILNFTNAREVISVDYVEAGMNKAVAFCTKTFNGIYTHTKPVCDRLKGAELLAIDTIRSDNFSFLRYHLKPINGLTEYAVSFSAGFTNQSQHFTLQSEWMTDSYAAQDTMLNFQLWSASKNLLQIMLKNVLKKLATTMPIQQSGMVKKPVTYITKAQRDANNQMNLMLTITNNTAVTAATIVISGKANEQTTTVTSHTYSVALTANGVSTITVPVKDMAETEIRLKINGAIEDFVYSNDGTWNVYKTPSTIISSYVISNDTVKSKQNEFRLFRNISIKAKTSDYVTVYKMVKGGGIAADLTAFSTFKFNASGTGKMRIRLIKKSITNYSEQYEYVQTLTPELKEYSINTDQFKSNGNSAPISLKDIVIVSFTYEATAPNTLIDAVLSNIRFAAKQATINTGASAIKLYPNPASKHVMLVFESAETETMQLVFTSVSGVRTALTQQVKVQKGMNNISIPIPSFINKGLYAIKLISNSQMFHSKLLVQ
jgi:hypothetical protein